MSFKFSTIHVSSKTPIEPLSLETFFKILSQELLTSSNETSDGLSFVLTAFLGSFLSVVVLGFDFSQKLLKDPFIASTVNEILGSSLTVKVVVDTEVEKIEEDTKEKVDQNDIVKLFDGKDFA